MKDSKMRRWALPLVFGLATANFIAVIQLVSQPQVQLNIPLLLKGSPPFSWSGFVGMTMMCASIPLLIGYAIYIEQSLETNLDSKFGHLALGIVTSIGLGGLAFTLFSFHPVFSLALFVGYLFTAFVLPRGGGFAWLEKR